MNKRNLLSAGMLTAFISGAVPPSRAQQLTLDLTQAAHAIVEIAQLKAQLEVALCAYQQAQATTAALQHANPGVGAPLMQLPGSAVPMLPGLTSGDALSAAGQQFFGSNGFAAPQGSDFAATELARQMTGTANIQGEAQAGMQAVAARIASLTQLTNQIQTAPDVTSLAAVNARIASEQMYLASQSNNIANLQMMAGQQQQASQLRAQQYGRQQADQAAAAAAANAGWSSAQ